MRRIMRRRRKECKTDYRARLALLKSNTPRLVVRRTNRYLVAQIVQSELAQDKILAGTTSKALLAKGWPEEKSGSLKSLTAAYLTGALLANLSASKKIPKLILDIGLHRNIHKSRIYALVRGAIDNGLKLSCNEKAMPSSKEILERNPELAKLSESIAKKLKSN